MRKLLSVLSIILCFALLQTGVFAAETPLEDRTSTKLSVSFKTGSGDYTVNGKIVKAESSVLTGGKIFVPVKVITDALGATLTVDLKAKTAVISYNNVDIKLTEKKKDAVIGGKKIQIDAAPYIKNNNFMATISFLADNLGADLTNNNGKVTFIKEIVNQNSIKDFSTLIKKSSKDKVGDSYYKWSMLLPDDLKLEYRSFNGTKNLFVAQDSSYIVTVGLAYTTAGASLDNAAAFIKDEISEYTLIDYTEDTINGVNYLEFIYKDDEWTVRRRIFLTSDKAFEVHILTKNDDAYDDDKYTALIDSFDFNYDKKVAEDLSDVSSGGFRKYQDTRLKWSMNMVPYWEEVKDDKIQNVIAFYGNEYEYLSVEVYSLDKGDTLDSVTQKILDNNAADFNSEFYQVIKQEKGKISGMDCNKVYYTLKYKNKLVYGCDMVITDKNYKYIITSEIPEDVYNNPKKKSLYDGMLDSFTFKQLDSKVIGKLLDPKKISLKDKTRKIDEETYTVNIPVGWTEANSSTKDSRIYGTRDISASISIIDGIQSVSDFVNYMEVQYAKDSKTKLESKETLSEKGTACYKYVYRTTDADGYTYRMVQYYVQKGTKVYMIMFFVDNDTYSTKNLNIINNVWQSFTLK